MASTTYGGITFPLGDLSFVDGINVLEFGSPEATGTSPQNLKGAPDGVFYSLGNGGRVQLDFTDNVLTSDGMSAPDLYIFESGSEQRGVSITSVDGQTTINLGTLSATQTSIDIDAFLRDAFTNGNYSFETPRAWGSVRITDRANVGETTGASVGPDIDAVGAITSARTVAGTGGADSLAGSSDAEFFNMSGGADTVSGGGGSDLVYAGEGDDIVFGGAGIDYIYGEGGDDQLFGGVAPEADYLSGGSGRDQIYANAGADTLDGGFNNDILGTGFGDDVAQGGTGNDTLFGGGDLGADSLMGGAGNDIGFGGGGDGTDTVYSGTGADTVFLGIDNTQNNLAVDGDRDVFGVISNNGADTIYGFETARDDIDLSQSTELNSFAQVQAAMSDGGGRTVIDLLNGNGSLTLVNVSMGNLTADNFIF